MRVAVFASLLAPGCAGEMKASHDSKGPAGDLLVKDCCSAELLLDLGGAAPDHPRALEAGPLDAWAGPDHWPAKDLPWPADTAMCPAVTPATSPDPWTVRVPGTAFGGILTQTVGKFTDVFLKGPQDYTRIGVRLNWGGTVVFFGLTANSGSNVIDANDTGRELQLALYDPTRAMQGCAYNASCQSGGTACPTSITYLGWNPVQGGDECNHGAPVTSHGQQGSALRVVVQPVQWNPDWDAPDCRKSACPAAGVPVKVTYTFELRYLSMHVVEVMSQVDSQESFSHPATSQEFPTLYVSHGSGGPDLSLLLDAAGNTVAITNKGNDGFYYANFTSQAPWVTWQDSKKAYGVGLAMDQGITSWQGWRGDGSSAPYFHNVRANIQFGLNAGKTVRGLSYLALGNYATVKSELSAMLAKRPPFGSLDAPAAPGASYSKGQALTVHGWTLDNAPGTKVAMEVDGKAAGALTTGQSRPDVCAVYPAYPGCPNVGFSGTLATASLGPCPHLLRVVATDSDGNTTVLGERKLTPQ